MASISVNTTLEILDLRHFSARQLRPLLEQEARLWQARLRWDYGSATDLLLQYLDSRILPGFVALDRGRICGFAFCVYEGSKAVIGDAFAVDNAALPAIATVHELLRQLVQLLEYSPEIERVESQLLLYNAGELAQPFDAGRFRTYRRLFMEVDLRPLRLARSQANTSPLMEGVALQPWNPADYQAAAELIHAAYVDHIDAEINDQYQTMQGSLRFLHNIVRFPGCGTFDPGFSSILRSRRDGSLVGILLCSRVRFDTAHITQLCIAKTHRGKKLGSVLLDHTMRALAGSGCDAITLTVTEANRPATDLYFAKRFTARQVFDAHVLERAGRPRTNFQVR